MNRLLYVFSKSGNPAITVHGHVWVSRKLVRFDSKMPWLARDVATNSVIGTALVKQTDVVLVYVRPGAHAFAHENYRLRKI